MGFEFLDSSYPTLHVPVFSHKKTFDGLLIFIRASIFISCSIFPLSFVFFFFCFHNHKYIKLRDYAQVSGV